MGHIINMAKEIGMKKEVFKDIQNPEGLLSERCGTDCPLLVRTAIAMIEEHYAFLYGIDDVAAQLEVTKPHLIRSFTAATQTSPGKYLTYIRLCHAKSMLRSNMDVPLVIVAGACGYSCANYFCKVFKKYTGLTPMVYAKSARDNMEEIENTKDPLTQRLYL